MRIKTKELTLKLGYHEFHCSTEWLESLNNVYVYSYNILLFNYYSTIFLIVFIGLLNTNSCLQQHSFGP